MNVNGIQGIARKNGTSSFFIIPQHARLPGGDPGLCVSCCCRGCICRIGYVFCIGYIGCICCIRCISLCCRGCIRCTGCICCPTLKTPYKRRGSTLHTHPPKNSPPTLCDGIEPSAALTLRALREIREIESSPGIGCICCICFRMQRYKGS